MKRSNFYEKIINFSFVTGTNLILAQTQEIKLLFQNNAIIYIPEDNETYVVENIDIQENENTTTIYFHNLKAILKGNWSNFIIQQNPSLRPIVKSDMKRKVLKSSIGTTYGVTCVPDGVICIILFPKRISDE